MKHAWKICMLLGILIVCLLLPVSSIHEGFRFGSRKKKRFAQKMQRKSYKTALQNMDCNAIQLEIDKYAHKPTYYKSIYAKREYEKKDCKSNESNPTTENNAAALEQLQSQLNEVSEKLDNTVVMEIPPGGGK
jgi:hypothetical protein